MSLRNKAITKQNQQALKPEEVLQGLIAGNHRFVTDTQNSVDTKALLHQTVLEQNPKAIILSCIDARVPVELLFDQTIGDIFVARVAGNFENTDILGSMEFACKVAGSKLIFVLGHQDCGSIKAACNDVKLGKITAMLQNIRPAITASLMEDNNDIISAKNIDFVRKVTENNVLLTIQRIREKSALLKEMEDKDEIKIVGGVYSLSTGKVTVL